MPKDTFLNLPEEKRKRIIDSAISVFSKSHYKKVTIDSLVNKADIPKGSFYQYFENKDDLYTYIFGQIGNQKILALEKIINQVDKLNFREFVIRSLEEAEKFLSRDAKLIGLKNKFMNECPQDVRKAVIKNELPKSYSLFEDVIKLYIEKGELRKSLNIKNTAYIITTCIVNLEDYVFDDDQDINNVIIDILDILIAGLKD